MRLLIVVLLALSLYGQGGENWETLRAQNPPGRDVSLRLVNSHPFRQGEVITAELNLPDRPAPTQQPPVEQWQFAGLLLDPAADCGTVAKPCWQNDPGGMDFSGLIDAQSQERRPLALNSFLPALAPGHYRVAALAKKLVLSSRNPGPTYLYPEPPQYAVSGAVEIDIVAPTAAWMNEAIARSVAALNGPEPKDAAGYQVRRDAARQLASLNDPGAWAASLEALPKEEAVLLSGLARGTPMVQVCDLMHARVSAPTQSVSSGYLQRLADICARANQPAAPANTAQAGTRLGMIVGVFSATPVRAAMPAAPVSAQDSQWQDWSMKWSNYRQEVTNKAAAALAGNLANKQPRPKWEAFATLLQQIQQVRNSRPPEPDPSWTPLLSAEFVREFPAIEVARKEYLLDQYVSLFDSPDVAPLLERVLDDWKPGEYYEAAHAAIRALDRVDHARARARILEELVKDQSWLDPASLELLPASDVPPMDDALIQSLGRSQRSGGWSPRLQMAAIARYATPQALPRIRAIYEAQRDSCQPELVSYFLRVDPDYAEQVFHSHTWDMQAQPPRCTVQYFNAIPPLAMSPALEEYLGAYLMHNDVYIKSTAAQVLARYGTPAALPRLWATFLYFHEYWKDKSTQLEQNNQSAGLETVLRDSIARARGWLVTEADLRQIESLCISGRCLQETRADLETLKLPLRIEINPQPVGIYGHVAQYNGLESVAAMKAKLAQYPAGTRFVLYAPPAAEKLGQEIRHFAAGKGLAVTTP